MLCNQINVGQLIWQEFGAEKIAGALWRWLWIAAGEKFLGGDLSRSAAAKTAESALEDALIFRFGCLGRVPNSFKLRSDNGLVFCSKTYTALVRAYGLEQEFITPYTPQQNGMVERLIRTIKEQCIYHHRFESIRNAESMIGKWIKFYNEERPHQSLGMKSPAKSFRLAA